MKTLDFKKVQALYSKDEFPEWRYPVRKNKVPKTGLFKNEEEE
jgi:hypothetical protein